MDKDILRLIRQTSANVIAESIINVQPMPSSIINELRKVSKTEKELVEDGYEPVSSIKLMYIKRGNDK